ncbi:DNA-binding PucR family transcriptional regulator [Pseudarthrobacter oxydans]|uniref:DNA-binding PucR family transcriptional regulator n=1 Tax=Pseudarthrobacter oxydans TaxID=1671 RepID=A0AAW8NHN0_PSEOX|nr:helix-turn-helix domain-containing protein [Pseudarthrobacter oxydans]MDR7165617.1 DNA-binding PucR family transcriptional regulator [Pseudarthrobacter oxydans]
MQLEDGLSGGERQQHIDELIGLLGADSVARVTQAGGDRVVKHIEFFESVGELPDSPGTLLLYGVRAEDHMGEAREVLSAASRFGYSGVAIKGEPRGIEYWKGIAEEFGLVLMKVNITLSWRTFEAMLAYAAGEQVGDIDYLAGSPLDLLSGIVNELAGYLGGSVVIEDLGRRPVVHSTVPGQLIDALRTQTILSRSTPPSPQDSEQYQAVLQSPVPVLQPKLPREALRTAVAVRAGTRPLGSMWAILPADPGAQWPDIADRMSASASRAAGVMLDLLRSSEMGVKDRAQRLRRILRANTVSDSDLTELGLSATQGLAFIAFDAGSQPQPGELDACRAMVQQQLRLLHAEALTAIEGTKVIALVESGSADMVAANASKVQLLLERSLGLHTTVAASNIVREAAELIAQRRLVERLLRAASQRPLPVKRQVLTIDSMRTQLFLSSVAELVAADSDLTLPGIAGMVSTDPDTADSLLAWIASGQNVTYAAEELGVHKNTVRYRLRKAQEHFGFNLKDPDEVLAIWLQLTLTSNDSVSTRRVRALPRHGGTTGRCR